MIMQGITTLLQELTPNIHIPYTGHADAIESKPKAQGQPPESSTNGDKDWDTKEKWSHPKTIIPTWASGRWVEKALMYEETAENTHSKALYLPRPHREDAGHGTLDATGIRRLIKEVLE